MSEDDKMADKPIENETEPEKQVKPLVMAVEEWAKQNPIKGVTAEMVLAQGRWAQGKQITQWQWLTTVKAILDTTIGFKN